MGNIQGLLAGQPQKERMRHDELRVPDEQDWKGEEHGHSKTRSH